MNPLAYYQQHVVGPAPMVTTRQTTLAHRVLTTTLFPKASTIYSTNNTMAPYY